MLLLLPGPAVPLGELMTLSRLLHYLECLCLLYPLALLVASISPAIDSELFRSKEAFSPATLRGLLSLPLLSYRLRKQIGEVRSV